MDLSRVNTAIAGFEDNLTSPFLIKKVTINAHTPYDEEVAAEDEVYSVGFFNKRLYAQICSEYQNISGSFKSQKEVIENSIDGGTSPLDAVQAYKAARAYGLSSVGSTSGVQRLSIYRNEV